MWTAPYALYSGGLTTTPVTSSVVDLLGTFDKHAVGVTVTATGGGDLHIKLEGSFDGSNWYSIIGDEDTGFATTGGELFAATGAARYVRFTTYVNIGTATVSILGASGTD